MSTSNKWDPRLISAVFFVLLFTISCSSVKDFSEFEDVPGTLIQTGIASWYGPKFHGRTTASGEIFDMNEYTAAHKTLPFGSIVRIINKVNKRSVIVKINDRGPFIKDRIIDLSRKSAEKIGLIESGYAKVDIILLNGTVLPKDLKIPSFTVQIGSYLNKEDAQRMMNKIRDARIVETKIKGRKYFRVYVGNYLDRKEAEKKQKSLKVKGIDGFVKQIQN